MNTNKFILLAILALLFSACDKRWNEPTFKAPTYQLSEEDIPYTIAELKELHNVVDDYPDSISTHRDYFIEAWVVSSDEGGNIYKSMMVQDATGAIQISIDKSGLYNEFPVGQKVYINCKGLVLGDYHNTHQLGWIYQGAIGRINGLCLDQYIHKDGLPTPDKVDFIKTPTLLSSEMDLTAENVSKLVRIDNCEFAEESIGKPLATNDYMTEHTVNFNGTSIVVRTSNYAKFRSLTCPKGKGTLYGILSVYNSTYQLSLRTRHDIQFEDAIESDFETVREYSFNENSFSEGWRNSDENSETPWSFVSSEQAVWHSPTGTTGDDWLISPSMTFEEINGLILRLEHKMLNFQGPIENYQIYYSTSDNGVDFNPEQWTQFTSKISVPGTSYEKSDMFSIAEIGNKTFKIAIRYNTSSTSNATRWFVKKLIFQKDMPIYHVDGL